MQRDPPDILFKNIFVQFFSICYFDSLVYLVF
jgi:hypothetical protein